MPSQAHWGKDRLRWLAAGSIGIGAAVLGLKLAAYWITGSIALYSDALESIINIVTAALAFSAILISDRPADSNHPYGHHKAEYFSAVAEGVMIVIAALLILREAAVNVSHPVAIATPLPGMALNGAATVVNAAWALVLLRQGRAARSPALQADGRHLMADVLTSAGVLVGLALQVATGWTTLDPALAALVAVNILWSGWGLVKESVGGLMDAALAPDTLDRVRAVISQHAAGAIEAHDLRTRRAGRSAFIDFHLVVPGGMSVSEAHGICDDLERALKREVDDALITIHVEPEDKAKHSGIVVL